MQMCENCQYWFPLREPDVVAVCLESRQIESCAEHWCEAYREVQPYGVLQSNDGVQATKSEYSKWQK